MKHSSVDRILALILIKSRTLWHIIINTIIKNIGGSKAKTKRDEKSDVHKLTGKKSLVTKQGALFK